MGATLRLTRKGGFSPGCARTLKVFLDGKEVQPIGAGKTVDYGVTEGGHSVKVKQDFCSSAPCTFQVSEGGVRSLECGSFVEGWMMFLFPIWFWRVLVPGTLFWVRTKGGK